MERLEKLKKLERDLLAAMNDADARNLAPLAKQYRETLREIEEIESNNDGLDEIARILANRKSNTDAASGA